MPKKQCKKQGSARANCDGVASDICKVSSIAKRIQWGHVGEEAKVVTVLLRLDERYRAYYKEWLKEFDVQRIAAHNLRTLTEIYCSLLENKCKPPVSREPDADNSVINKFQLHYQVVMGSINALYRGLKRIRVTLLNFRAECAGLDLTAETPFNLGDTFHKPIKFFIDLAEELFCYFHSSYLKLDYAASLLDQSDLAAVERYQKFLAPCEEFGEYLEYNLSYCHCLRPSEPCPGVVMPRVSVQRTNELVQQAKQKRCSQRFLKMSKQKEDNIIADKIMESGSEDVEHEERMTQLAIRMDELRQRGNSAISIDHENHLVQQVLYALSPSLMPTNFVAQPSASVEILAKNSNVVE